MSIDRSTQPDAEALNRLIGHEHIVFLGTYNADPFRSKVEAWLFELDLSETALVVANLIPRPIMKFLFKRFMATRLGKRMFQAWDFDWDRK